MIWKFLSDGSNLLYFFALFLNSGDDTYHIYENIQIFWFGAFFSFGFYLFQEILANNPQKLKNIKVDQRKAKIYVISYFENNVIIVFFLCLELKTREMARGFLERDI